MKTIAKVFALCTNFYIFIPCAEIRSQSQHKAIKHHNKPLKKVFLWRRERKILVCSRKHLLSNRFPCFSFSWFLMSGSINFFALFCKAIKHRNFTSSTSFTNVLFQRSSLFWLTENVWERRRRITRGKNSVDLTTRWCCWERKWNGFFFPSEMLSLTILSRFNMLIKCQKLAGDKICTSMVLRYA